MCVCVRTTFEGDKNLKICNYKLHVVGLFYCLLKTKTQVDFYFLLFRDIYTQNIWHFLLLVLKN